MKSSRLTASALMLALSALGAQSAMASTFNFSGTFTQDDNYQFLTFTISALTTVTLQTTSYTTGGFVPYIHVWDSTGIDLSGVEPTLSNAIYSPNLPAGTYYAGLTVANNKATGNFPGGSPTPTVFDHNGLGNFTFSAFSCAGYGIDGPFYDSACGSHTGNWALSITGADSSSLYPAAVPVPPVLSLMASGLAALFAPLIRRRKVPQA